MTREYYLKHRKEILKYHKKYFIKNKCMDCGKKVSTEHTKRCRKCYIIFSKGKNATNYKNGRSLIEKFCIDCGKKIDWKSKNNYCKNHVGKYVSPKAENSYNYIDGRCSKKYYCIICGKEISLSSGFYGNKKCSSCHAKTKTPTFGKLPSHGKRIHYKNNCFRSTWESNFAKWLDKNNIKWLYESKTFKLDNGTYTPDFYLPEFNLWIEVKGYWRDNAKVKFELFKQKYCGERIKILGRQELKILKII